MITQPAEVKRLVEDALKLPPGDRAVIADALLGSLPPAPGIGEAREDDPAFLAELEALVDAVDNGTMPTRPGEDVHRELLKLYGPKD